MMKTPDDVQSIIYARLVANAELVGTLAGKIKKQTRPKAGNGEYIIINTLPLYGKEVQTCRANVNIFVPAVIDGEGFEAPNTVRMNALTALVTPLLEVTNQQMVLYVDSQDDLYDELREVWYTRVLVDCRFFNIT